MKALFIAPLPPPHTGNSLPVQVLCESLRAEHQVEVVNLSKAQHRSGVDSLGRVIKIMGIMCSVWKRQGRCEVVYLTIAESLAGNIRDIIFYLICSRKLNTVVIHMLGGAGMKRILARRHSIRRMANEFFLKRVGAIVVEGATQGLMFARVAKKERIHVIHNFAEDHLFLSDEVIEKKFNSTNPLKLLFLSNMLAGKGHLELLEAFSRLDRTIQNSLVLDLAGKVVTIEDQRRIDTFLEKMPSVRYHGSVSGERKRELYANAHVFCLPTYYPYEGQPFSIVEAYASGCFVITTNHSGIGDIFSDGINGVEVEKQCVESLVVAIEAVARKRSALSSVAFSNAAKARQIHTQGEFEMAMKTVLTTVHAKT